MVNHRQASANTCLIAPSRFNLLRQQSHFSLAPRDTETGEFQLAQSTSQVLVEFERQRSTQIEWSAVPYVKNQVSGHLILIHPLFYHNYLAY